MAKTDEQEMEDRARTLRVIVATERLVVELEAHTNLLRDLIEEERRGRKDD